MSRCILILEPPGLSLDSLYHAFAGQAGPNCQIRRVHSSDELLNQLGAAEFAHAVLVHGELGDGHCNGLELVPVLREVDPFAPIVVVADKGDVASAARAIKAGAADFLVRGEKIEQRVATLLQKLSGQLEMIERNRALDKENTNLRETLDAGRRIIGCSPAWKKLVETIERLASIPRPVLIQGERGTGKELVARAIHDAAGELSRPIITVNCAAFGENMLESELFGHEKGAFTGADSLRRGKFEQANGGTLFLDEIGHMPLPFQQKILRVVEYGTYHRVGGNAELKTSARLIAATNRDLKDKIRCGEFLEDLYDRLSFEVILVPPLRRRIRDIEPLANHFLECFASEIPAFAGKTLAPEALGMLKKYHFPGNIRELKNIIERAAYRDTTNQITPEDIGLLAAEEVMGPGSFTEKVDAFSRRLLSDALVQADGNQAQAARNLGLTYHQFRYYHKKYLAEDA